MIKIRRRVLILMLLLVFAVCGLSVIAMNPTVAYAADASINTSLTKGDSAEVVTSSYERPDNSGYEPVGTPLYGTSHPLGGKLATISVDVLPETGKVIGGTYNGYNSYAFISGDSVANGRVVEIKLKYNQSRTTEILGKNGRLYDISDDTYKKPIAGFQVGVVGTGALIIQKSYDGKNWGWENPISGGTTSNLHTTNFITNFKPENYNGTKTSDTSDGKLIVYSPLGEDLMKGVYIKVLFCYEIKYFTTHTKKEGGFLGIGAKTVEYKEWHYSNVVEESKFYLANGSGEVCFTNAYVDDGLPKDEEAESMSEAVRMFGTIKDGHASNEGFRLNTFGNDSYKIQYSYNGSQLKTAVDGQFFAEPGRYDFKVTTKANTVKNTTLYINEQGINRNIEKYFGDSLFTANSKRVFSTGDAVPVYVAGETWYKTKAINNNSIPLSGFIKNAETDEVVATINGSFTEKEGQKIFNGAESRSSFSGLLNKPGSYIAEFANNKDYFNNLQSGDSYHFVFKFVLIDPKDNPGPMINSELLKSNFSFNDYAAGYWGVRLPSKGSGFVTFAFSDYASAYDVAYDYNRSLVAIQGNKYIFKGVTYDSQFDVLEKVTKAAEENIVRRYFDATNSDSYLTVQDAMDDILNQSFSKDIVVFADVYAADEARIGEPFLNDRKFNYLNSDGAITSGSVPMRFITVADYESSQVELFHEGSNWSTKIDYDAPIQSILEGRNAPTGRYKIVEKNKYGDKIEYYGIYVRPGDIGTNLTLDRFLNNTLAPHTLSKSNSEQLFTANGFVLRKAENNLDPYGVVKIEKIGFPEYTKIFELSEVNDIIVDEEGSFAVSLIDRLGNSAKFYFNISTAKKASRITLENCGETHSSFIAFDGQTVKLPMPENPDNLFEFKGWQTENGERLSGEVVFRETTNVALTAVWNYKNTTINIFDGEKIKTETAKPEDTVVLPVVTKTGFALYGWLYEEADGSLRFYRGQITSVPNVQDMRLTAVWRRNYASLTPESGTGNQIKVTLVDGTVKNVLTGTKGGALALPAPTSDGLIFAGWLSQSAPLSGWIFEDSISELPDQNSLVLYALWMTDPNGGTTGDAQGSGGTVAGTISGGGAGAFFGKLFSAKNLTAMFSTFAGFLILALIVVLFKKARQKNRGFQTNTSNTVNQKTKVVAVVYSVKPVKEKRIKVPFFLPKVKNQGGEAAIRRKGAYWRIAVSVVSIAMVLVFVCLATYKFSFGIRDARILAKAEREYGAAVTLLQSEQILKDEEIAKRNDYIAQASRIYSDTDSFLISEYSTTDFVDEHNMTDEEIFLVSLIFLDLVTFGYDVFPATAIKADGIKINGIGFSEYSDAYEFDGDNKVYFSGSFIAFTNQPMILESDVDDGIIIVPTHDGIAPNEYAYILDFKEEYGNCHYIAFEQYFLYSVNDFRIEYTSTNNDSAHYNYNLGYLYSYDIGRPVYDPDLGKSFESSGFSLTESTDYDFVLNAYRAFIIEQNQNGLSIDTASVTFISNQAINDYIANNQDESFLGLTPEELMSIEAQLPNTHFYVVMENGEIEILELPPDPPPKASLFEKILVSYLAVCAIVGSIVVGIACTVVTAGAGTIAAGMAMGAITGAAIEMFMQVVVQGVPLSNVSWLKVGVAAVSGAVCAIPGIGWVGAALVGGATNAAMTYIDGGDLKDCLLSFGIGVATGVLIHFGAKAIGKVSSKVMNKLKCFAAGTAVLVAGVGGVIVAKNIENIAVGDQVLSYNEFTDIVEIKDVTETFTSQHTELIKLTTNSGNCITSSLDHPYYVVNKGMWIAAQHLRAGDVLRTVNGDKVIVEQIQHELLESPIILYNFEVEDNHNYYVAENIHSNKNEFVLTHNKCDFYAYKLTFKDSMGKTYQYIGKGTGGRAADSVNRITKEYATQGLKLVGKPQIYRAATERAAFILEAKLMNQAARNGIQLINKIASPGHTYMGASQADRALLRNYLNGKGWRF